MNIKEKRKKLFTKARKYFDNIFDCNKESSFNTIEVAVVIVISILFGIITGCILTYGKGFNSNTNDNYTNELLNTYNTILENYYDDVNNEDLLNAAINGMVGSLGDINSYYMDSIDTVNFNQLINGSFVGIGTKVSFGDTEKTIVEIFDNSPAEKVGLQVGDVILEINDKNVSNASIEEVMSLLDGKDGTKVKMKIKRGTEEKSFLLTRDVIIIPSVFSKINKVNNKNIGFIDIDVFASNTFDQFKSHLGDLEKQNISGLIIDVRDNFGGHLSQVNKILSLFFNNKTVLYQIETKGNIEKIYSDGKKGKNYEVVVLLNDNSASASEILASCFQSNYKNATVIGNKSYGKGTIQSAIKLSTGASLKYTTQKWLTADGLWVDGVGVSPDEEVNIENDYYVVAGEYDLQYDRAIKILSE